MHYCHKSPIISSGFSAASTSDPPCSSRGAGNVVASLSSPISQARTMWLSQGAAIFVNQLSLFSANSLSTGQSALAAFGARMSSEKGSATRCPAINPPSTSACRCTMHQTFPPLQEMRPAADEKGKSSASLGPRAAPLCLAQAAAWPRPTPRAPTLG